jgi:hypothetical protein
VASQKSSHMTLIRQSDFLEEGASECVLISNWELTQRDIVPQQVCEIVPKDDRAWTKFRLQFLAF